MDVICSGFKDSWLVSVGLDGWWFLRLADFCRFLQHDVVHRFQGRIHDMILPKFL